MPAAQRRSWLTVLVLLAIVLPAFGAAFNFFMGWMVRTRFPAPGVIVPVNGYGMHLYCTGIGSPTVVLEAGGGDDWIYWQRVQPEVARTTRICSYDRAGLGWSQPQPGLRDARHIASQLICRRV